MVIRNTIHNTIQIRIIHNTHGFPAYYATLSATTVSAKTVSATTVSATTVSATTVSATTVSGGRR